jgi:Family of unknown function (DUF5647)
VTTSTDIDRKSAAQVVKNLELGRRHSLSIFEDPSLLDDIPDGITLILIPDDDEELAKANMEMMVGAVRSGRDVLVRLVRPSELPT